MKRIAIALLFVFCLCSLCYSADRATLKEAQGMLKKAVSFLKTNGKEKSFSAFNNPKGKFIDRDLYIFVLDMKGTVASYGANRAMIGRDLFSLKDPDGKQFVKEMVDIAKTKGRGSVDYKWTNPISKKIENKRVFFERVGEYIVGCGAYR